MTFAASQRVFSFRDIPFYRTIALGVNAIYYCRFEK